MKTYRVYTDNGIRCIKAESFIFTVDTLKLTKMGNNGEEVSVAAFMSTRVMGIVDKNHELTGDSIK